MRGVKRREPNKIARVQDGSRNKNVHDELTTGRRYLRVTNIPTFELLCVAKIHPEICGPSSLNFHVLDHRRTLKRKAFVSLLNAKLFHNCDK